MANYWKIFILIRSCYLIITKLYIHRETLNELITLINLMLASL